MKEKLERESLHTIAVPKNEVVWAKYNKEIIVEDKMFDVHSFSKKDGMFLFLGLFDSEETALNELLEKNTDNKHEDELLSELFQCLQSPCTNLSFDQVLIPAQSNTYFFPIFRHISSPFITIPSPPPQHC